MENSPKQIEELEDEGRVSWLELIRALPEMYREYKRMKLVLPKLIKAVEDVTQVISFAKQQVGGVSVAGVQSLAEQVLGDQVGKRYLEGEKKPLIEGALQLLKIRRDAIQNSSAVGSHEIRTKNLALNNLDTEITRLEGELTNLLSGRTTEVR
jgi:hypothetical protein